MTPCLFQSTVTWALNELMKSEITYGDFFLQAPEPNPKRSLIQGVVCGVRVEEIEEPLMREIRYLDKLGLSEPAFPEEMKAAKARTYNRL